MKLGSPATGNDFLGRWQELQDLWRYLEGEHIKLPGVRRLGKTSILHKLLDQAPEHGLLARWIDVSTLDSPVQLVDRLSAEFPAPAIQQFLTSSSAQVSGWLQRVKKVEGKLPEVLGGAGASLELHAAHSSPWLKSAHTLQTRLQAQPLLILLDEFPVMLQKIVAQQPQEAERLLTWLRTWRQSPGACRFLFTGSIGLESLLERHGLAVHMNDCMDYPLGPFKLPEARDLWQRFAAQSGWISAASSTEHAMQRVGWLSPYLLCLLLDESLKAARERVQESSMLATPGADHKLIEIEDIDSAYDNLLAARSRFHHWEKRLKDNLAEPELGFCLALLTHLSRKPEGLTLKQLSTRLSKLEPDAQRRATQVQDMLARLSDEGYTSPPDAQQRVQFRSFLLRDWWSRNHV